MAFTKELIHGFIREQIHQGSVHYHNQPRYHMEKTHMMLVYTMESLMDIVFSKKDILVQKKDVILVYMKDTMVVHKKDVKEDMILHVYKKVIVVVHMNMVFLMKDMMVVEKKDVLAAMEVHMVDAYEDVVYVEWIKQILKGMAKLNGNEFFSLCLPLSNGSWSWLYKKSTTLLQNRFPKSDFEIWDLGFLKLTIKF